jgi:hypothetical protein
MRIQLKSVFFSLSCDGYEVRGTGSEDGRARLNGLCRVGVLSLILIMMSLSDLKEKELTTRQAALVDSAFEEGQYESGIAMLEQLCSPTDYPSR